MTEPTAETRVPRRPMTMAEHIRAITVSLVGTGLMLGAFALLLTLFKHRHETPITKTELIVVLFIFATGVIIGYWRYLKGAVADLSARAVDIIKARKGGAP